jgi:hypothetical protein
MIFFVLILPVVLVAEWALAGWLFMLALGNLHHYAPAVPAVGFGGSLSIAVPLAAFMWVATWKYEKD